MPNPLPGSHAGIYAAVVTPYNSEGEPCAEQMAACLKHLARNGCSGALLAGTTGEGQSLSAAERITVFRAAAQDRHGLRLLAGTGAASLEDAVALTRAAFDLGLDAAMLIPPFFFIDADEEGLFSFYAEVIRRAVPSDGVIMLYNNPAACGIALPPALIRRLRDAYPDQMIGIKDSRNDREQVLNLIEMLPGFQVLVGHDLHLAAALAAGGSGAITLVANAFPSLLRDVVDAHTSGQPTGEAQERLDGAYHQFDGLPRIAAIKALLAASGIIREPHVRPPLRGLTAGEEALLRTRFLLDVPIPRQVRLSDLYAAHDGDES